MKGYLRSMVGRAKGQKNPRALLPAAAPLWAATNPGETGPHTKHNESAMQEWPDAFTGNPVDMSAPQAKSAIVHPEGSGPAARPPISPKSAATAPDSPAAEVSETVHLQPPIPLSPLAFADSILGPLVPPPPTEFPASPVPPTTQLQPEPESGPLPITQPQLGKGPRPLQALRSESGLMPALTPQARQQGKTPQLDPEAASPTAPRVPQDQKAAQLQPQAQHNAQLGQQQRIQPPLAPGMQQPSLMPLRMQPPAPQRHEAAATRQGLVIGKLTIEVVEPAKPQVVTQQQQPAQRSATSPTRNQSSRPHSNLKYGLGQL